MEQIIRRRYPNSLSALIFSARSEGADDDATGSAASAELMEKSVKRLHDELKRKDEEWERKMRALQQRHHLLEVSKAKNCWLDSSL